MSGVSLLEQIAQVRESFVSEPNVGVPDNESLNNHDFSGASLLNADGLFDQVQHDSAKPAEELKSKNVVKLKKMEFEVDPVARKRLQTGLLKRIRRLTAEYCARVGEQAAFVCYVRRQPAESRTVAVMRAFGSQPLEDVLLSFRSPILQEMQMRIHVQQNLLKAVEATFGPLGARSSGMRDPSDIPRDLPEKQQYLPPLEVDGVPTPIEKMTLQQLRTFIPLMMKHSTGYSKPRWGHPEFQPPWWPTDVPWDNVRLDTRLSDEEKLKQPWTQALRKVVRECYKFHNRMDLIDAANPGSGMWKKSLMLSGINPDPPIVLLVQNDPAPRSKMDASDSSNYVKILPAPSNSSCAAELFTLPPALAGASCSSASTTGGTVGVNGSQSHSLPKQKLVPIKSTSQSRSSRQKHVKVVSANDDVKRFQGCQPQQSGSQQFSQQQTLKRKQRDQPHNNSDPSGGEALLNGLAYGQQ